MVTARRLLRTLAAWMAPYSVKGPGELAVGPGPAFMSQMRYQSGVFGGEEAKHKIRESLAVALDGLVEPPGSDAVDCSEIAVEDHAVGAKDEDGPVDLLDWARPPWFWSWRYASTALLGE